MKRWIIERMARGMHAVDFNNGDAIAEWDFGPAEFMRHIYLKRAEAAFNGLIGRS